MKALEDCASADPGFEPCADPDCDGSLTSRGKRIECSQCGRTHDEVEEEINGDDDGGDEE